MCVRKIHAKKLDGRDLEGKEFLLYQREGGPFLEVEWDAWRQAIKGPTQVPWCPMVLVGAISHCGSRHGRSEEDISEMGAIGSTQPQNESTMPLV
eukprot:scaffold139_cov325-Pavlova_lutheri.AAC.73